MHQIRKWTSGMICAEIFKRIGVFEFADLVKRVGCFFPQCFRKVADNKTDGKRHSG
jgi:hypothetical protein